MKAIKRINNNVVICLDKTGNEVIARGKGIGFHDIPYEVDIKKIERTYYDVDESYALMINSIPEEILEIATITVDKYRNEMHKQISSNIIFTLADHINFAIQRYHKNLNFKLPITYDIQYLFEKEVDIGKDCLEMIDNKMGVKLPNEEAIYIALHIINAEQKEISNQTIDDETVIEKITQIIEKEFDININKNDFNYSRFVSHMHYLFKREKSNEMIKSENKKLYLCTKNEYPKTNECVEKISEYLKQKCNMYLTDEEKLYLMLHINRLYTREECNH